MAVGLLCDIPSPLTHHFAVLGNANFIPFFLSHAYTTLRCAADVLFSGLLCCAVTYACMHAYLDTDTLASYLHYYSSPNPSHIPHRATPYIPTHSTPLRSKTIARTIHSHGMR